MHAFSHGGIDDVKALVQTTCQSTLTITLSGRCQGLSEVDYTTSTRALTMGAGHEMIFISTATIIKEMMKMATINTTELATELDTTPRTLRKFLRADAKERGTETPGKGSRYSIERREVKALAKRFTAWSEAQAKQDENPDEGSGTDDA